MNWRQPLIMDKSNVKSAVKNYGEAWGISLQNIYDIQGNYSGYWPRRQLYAIDARFECTNGAGNAHLWWIPELCIKRFEFYPTTPQALMLPPWGAYPGEASWRGGWRQGYGEVYLHRWHIWYNALDYEAQIHYQQRFQPLDDNELCWQDFYSLRA